MPRGEIIVLDPMTESSANAPLQLSGDEANGIALIEHDYPDPDSASLYASGPDTEGERRAATRPHNRKIPVKLRVLEPQLPALTNWVPNPSLERDASLWSMITASTPGQITVLTAERSTEWAAAGDYSWHLAATIDNTGVGHKPVNAGRSTNTDIQVIPGTVISGGFRTNIDAHPGGPTGARLEFFTAAGAPVGAASNGPASPGTGEQVLKVENVLVPATAARAQLSVLTSATVAGNPFEIWVDAAMVVIGATLPSDYFDGDTPGCTWSTPHAGTSTRAGAGGDRLQAIVADIEDKVSKLDDDGGTYRRRLPNTGDDIIFDVIEARVVSIDHGKRFGTRKATEISLEFGARPRGRGAPVAYQVNSETTLPALIYTQATIPGTAPAIGELTITEDEGEDQATVLWGIDYYTPGDDDLLQQAEAFTIDPLGTHASLAAGPAGASGGGANKTMLVDSTGSLTGYAGDFYRELNLVGSYRVLARVSAPGSNSDPVTAFLYWAATGSAYANMARNAGVRIDPGALDWVPIDLGIVHRRPPPYGSSALRLTPTILVETIGDSLYWDYLLLIPVTYAAGQASTPEGLAATALPALPANGELVIASDHVLATGAFSGAPSLYEGDYLKIPHSGREGRMIRIVVKACRGNLNVDEDAAIDDISAQLTFSPRWHSVPRP